MTIFSTFVCIERLRPFALDNTFPLGTEDGEMMIFFSFLLSHRILPLHTMEYILGFEAVGRFADTVDSRNEEGGVAG